VPQAQRPDLVILDRLEHDRHRLALIKLTCPWDTDDKRAGEDKASRYADLKTVLSYEGWDSSLYLIEVGVQGHILKSVKDHLWSLFQAWVPAGHRLGILQMISHVNWILLVCSFSIFEVCNDPDWSSPHLVTQHTDGVPTRK
jgi:hypothetical protein